MHTWVERKQGLWLWTFEKNCWVGVWPKPALCPGHRWGARGCEKNHDALWLGACSVFELIYFSEAERGLTLPDPHDVIKVSFLILSAIGVWLWATRGIVTGISHVENRKLLMMGYHALPISCCSFLSQIPAVSFSICHNQVCLSRNKPQRNECWESAFPPFMVVGIFNERDFLLESRDCICSVHL